jgi:molybdate transport system ATP-binding protein
MSSLLTANFVKRFRTGAEIRVETLEIRTEAMVAILFGPSGAGKTTVLKCLAGLERPEGKISFGEKVWLDSSARICAPARERSVGFVPQQFGLFPHLTVEQNIGYGLNRMRHQLRVSRVTEIVRWLGLAGLEKRRPMQLSGGQQQRVALGRAIAPSPGLLLLDEPLGALDSPTRLRLRSELRQLLREAAIPALLVTHDRTDALALGDDLIIMNHGQIAQQGTVAHVFSHPASLSVAEIVAVETVQPGRIVEKGDMVTVAIAGKLLLALGKDLVQGATDVFVCIRAEDVILIRGDMVHGSARNSLAATVTEVVPQGPIASIALDCGFPLKASLTRQACEELSLAPGVRVQALIKAPNVHLIARG